MPEYYRFARPRRQTRYIRSLVNTKGSRQHVHQGNQNPQHRRRQTRPPARAFSTHRRQGQAAHPASAPTIRWRARTGRRLPPKRWPPAAVRSRVQAAAEDIVNRSPEVPRRRSGGRRTQIATVNLDSLEHENPRSVGCLCLEARSRLHDLGITSALIVARMIRPASANCAMTARPRSFRRASRARRCTASATCVTGPPGAVQPRARAASSIPSLFAISPMFTAAPTASSPASGARSAMIAPRLRGAGFRRSCEVLRGNVAGHGCADEAGGGR